MIRVKPIIPKALRMFLPKVHKAAIAKALDQAVAAGQAEIGALTKTWKTPPNVQVQRADDRATIAIDDQRWLFLDEGTKPHVIRPWRKRALFWPGARHPVRQVRHPGIKARYLTKAVQRKVDATNLAATFANAIAALTK